MKVKQFCFLLLITIGSLLLHGYHPWAEDAEIYIPGIEKKLQPELFPFNAQFFQSHAHLTLFPNLVASLVRVCHVPLEFMLFFLQVVSIFLLLFACWQVSVRCFNDPYARWAAVAIIAALLTLPIAGTALYIMDQYLNPRNLTAFAGVLAIAQVLDRKYVQAGVLLVFAGLFHTLMSAFALSFCMVLIVLRRYDLRLASPACFWPFGLSLDPPPATYHPVAVAHSYHYFLKWHWYEFLGAFGPLAILWWFSREARRRQLLNLDLLCRALIIYELIYLPPAVILSSSPRFETLARLQPMRCLYLVYILLFLFIGGWLGQLVLKNRPARWLVLFVPLCSGMFLAQRVLFPASAHVEWPGARPKNPWVQAFTWIRQDTPVDAVFALDPDHMEIPGEDENGFRVIAERSMLADAVKDNGAVSMFPSLADEWFRQVQAQAGWKDFQAADFRRLRMQYGVTWVVLQKPATVNFDCPYQNEVVLVCRLP